MNGLWQLKALGCVSTLQRGFDLPSYNRVAGDYPIISSGGVSGYHNEAKVKGPGVVTGRYGSLGEVFFVEGDFWPLNTTLWVKDFHGNHEKFVYYLLSSQNFKKFSDKTGVPGVNRNDLHKIKVHLPSVSIQEKIVTILSTWDQSIEKTERLIAAKEKQYRCLLSGLLSNNRHKRGHIRDFTIEISKRNNGVAIDRVLSVTNRNGFVLPEDQFERRVASADLSNYKIVLKGEYAYNPSRINVGSISRLDSWDEGVLSPMYVVFEIDDKKVNSDFFLHWLSSHEAKGRIRRSAQGSVRETVSFTDLGAISFPLPSLDKQIAVASILNITRKEIDLLRKQLEAYRKQKRGLMQKLLTGKWRVKVYEEAISK
ncbi:MAG: restriction endonuclease subunit S [Proteobacteria bacterium]|nr:restriction endonuclease subunit S [Pseudomonadota bacterium]